MIVRGLGRAFLCLSVCLTLTLSLTLTLTLTLTLILGGGDYELYSHARTVGHAVDSVEETISEVRWLGLGLGFVPDHHSLRRARCQHAHLTLT